MEQIVLQIQNKDKARLLLELLSALDFVDIVRAHHLPSPEEQLDKPTSDAQIDDDFFALAGIWAGRDITIESLRQQAWPRQSP